MFTLKNLEEIQKTLKKILKNQWLPFKNNLKQLLQGCYTIRKFREFENQRNSQGNSGNFDFIFKFREILIFLKTSGKFKN